MNRAATDDSMFTRSVAAPFMAHYQLSFQSISGLVISNPFTIFQRFSASVPHWNFGVFTGQIGDF
jgi:hypothetical protein